MAKSNFALIEKFIGYNTRQDQTNTDDRYLIDGSQNVLINEAGLIQTRPGFARRGAADSSGNAVVSSFNWDNSSGSTRELRFATDASDTLQFFDTNPATDIWEPLLTGLDSDFPIRFTKFWSTTELFDLLLFVNNSSTVYIWSGGSTTFSSATATTITKQGTGTFATSRFLSNDISGGSAREVRIKDSGGTWRAFTYTGGEGTTTLTGVSPNPTTFTFNAGTTIIQSVSTRANTPVSGYTNNFISNLNNHIFYGSATSQLIYMSSNTAFFTTAPSTVRLRGEGANDLYVDEPPTGFMPFDKDMIIFCNPNSIYKTNFEVVDVNSTPAVREVIGLKKFKTGVLQSAQSQEFITTLGNYIAYLSNEPALRLLGQVENIENPFLQSLSNPVKPDFDSATFTNGQLIFWRNRLILTAPTDGKVFINETVEDAGGTLRRFWQPPQIIPVRSMYINAGRLYGHSSGNTETFELFNRDNTSDAGAGFIAKAAFAYRSFGNREYLKSSDEYMVEGYISANTDLTLRLKFDFQGITQTSEYSILGSDESILFGLQADSSLGTDPLGDTTIGGDAATNAVLALDKFRLVKEHPREEYFELGVEFETSATDAQWAILSHGGNIRISTTIPTYIKQ